MYRLLLTLLLLTSGAAALRCYFQSVPLAREAETPDVKAAAEYECPASDKFCIYFKGSLKAKNETHSFSIKSCESDISYYLKPTGDKLGSKIDAVCKNSGKVEGKAGPVSYLYNCCTDPDCTSAAVAVSGSQLLIMILAGLVAFSRLL